MLGLLMLVTAAAEAAPSPCLLQPLAACLKVIGNHMTISPMNDIQDQLAHLKEVDVNGKLLSNDRRVRVAGTWPGESGVDIVFLDLDDHDTVTAIKFEMPGNPQIARTTEDYDRTRLYEMAQTVFDPACWGGDRLSLYRFFQNDVKPRIKIEDSGEKFDGTDTSSSLTAETPALPFCGHQFLFSSYIRKSTAQITMDNRQGISGITTIEFQ